MLSSPFDFLWHPYIAAFPSLSFLYELGAILRVRPRKAVIPGDIAPMLFNLKNEDGLDRLAEQLRLARAPACDLVADVIVGACPVLKRTGKAALIDRLIEAGAWTDAALALIEIELPAWKLRRLVHEDGEWLCSLSRWPNLPAELDDSADAMHEALPLAILSALVEARANPALCG